MRRLVAFYRSWVEAFRLARRIQRGELIAVRPGLLQPAIVRVPAQEPSPAPLPAVEPAGAPHDPSLRYEIRLIRNGVPKTRLRTNDVSEAKAAFNAPAHAGVAVEFYDHALKLVRGRH